MVDIVKDGEGGRRVAGAGRRPVPARRSDPPSDGSPSSSTPSGPTCSPPLHLHTREDEYSLVLEGRLGALLGGDEVYAEEGDFLAKPRGEWHTFWNPGDTTLRLLEIITPGGLEELFKTSATPTTYDPGALPALAAEYGGAVDFERTMAIATRFGLEF